MKKNKIIILVCIVILILLINFLAMFCEIEFLNKSILALGSGLDVIQTIATIVIAYLLYDRFGTAKKLLDRRNELVIELLIELKKIKISFAVLNKKEGPITEFPSRNFGSKIKASNISEEYMNRVVIFKKNSSFLYFYKVLDIINNPLFPTKLIKTKEFFSGRVYTNALAKKLGNKLIFAKIHSDSEPYHFFDYKKDNLNLDDPEVKKNMLWRYDEQNLLLKTLLTNIEDVVQEIENWINHNSTIRIKLNME